MKDIKLLKNIVDIYNMNVDEIKKLNIGIELQTFPQHILDDDYSSIIKECKEKLSNINNIISIHGSSFDLNPGSTDKKVLELTKYRYMQSINIAKEVGAKFVVFHSQLNPLISVDKIRKLKLNNQINFWKEFLNDISDVDIVILLENEYDDNYEELLSIIKEVNSEKLRICLDTGHALAYSSINLKEWVSGLSDYIEYIHLHYNDSSFDSHNEPSIKQLIEFNDILNNANINPYICLEYGVDDLEGGINRIKKYLI